MTLAGSINLLLAVAPLQYHGKLLSEFWHAWRAASTCMHAGLYICVESPVSITTFTMRAASHACPLRIMGDANLELCNGHAAADTCPNGVCTCAAPYAPPSPAIYPGKGGSLSSKQSDRNHWSEALCGWLFSVLSH